VAKVRITVAKQVVHQDLVDRYMNKARFPVMVEICPLVEGQAAV
jgi:hypothetical protein